MKRRLCGQKPDKSGHKPLSSTIEGGRKMFKTSNLVLRFKEMERGYNLQPALTALILSISFLTITDFALAK
jgi:hypothetical protein